MLGVSAPPSERSPPPLFGRHEVQDHVLRLLQEVTDGGPGRLLLLIGSGGVGKSTLLRTSMTAATASGYLVLSGRALPVEIPRPFGLVEDLLRAAQAFRRTPGTEEDQLSPSLPLFAAAFAPEPSSRLAEATGLADEPREIEEADRLIAHLSNPIERIDADRSSFYGRLNDFFLELARDRPLLIAVDDLQFADDSSLEFLRRLSLSIHVARVAILATSLDASETPMRTEAVLEKILAGPSASSMRVRPLTETELAAYVRWLLNGRDPGRDAVMRWFSQTEGNPLFTEYLVRATTGFGAPSAGGESNRADFGELLRARIQSLDGAEQRVLVHASVLGKEFDFPTLDLACGQEEERLSEHVDRLVHDGLVREKGGEVYEFVSERVRADVYAQLTETRRRLLHRKVAAALLKRDGVTARNLFELARQFYLGRDDARAADLNHRAADAASRAFAFDTAVVHLERALECQRRIVPRDVSSELRLMIELGRCHDELGDLRHAEEVLLDAVARARAIPAHETDLALALLGLAQTRANLTQYVSCRDLATEAFSILERLGHRRGLLTAHRALGVACWRMGDLEEAERHQRAELELATTDGTPAERGHALIDLANTFTLRGPDRLREAGELYEQAAAIFAEIHDPAAEARVLMNRSLLHHYAGETDASIEVMDEALAAAERSRSPIWIGYASLNLAQFHVETGDVERAKVAIERANALLAPLGDQLAFQQTRMIQGMIAAREKRWEEAEALFEESLNLARDLSLSAELAEMQFRLAELSYERGDPMRAKKFLSDVQSAGVATLRADLALQVEQLSQRIAGPT